MPDPVSPTIPIVDPKGIDAEKFSNKDSPPGYLKNTDLKLISFLRFSTSRDESLSLISISEFIKLKILLLDAIDLSKSSTSIERLVNGHKKRCVKKTSTLYAPTAKVPLSAIELPISIVPKNPARTPILITGLNALLIDIAFMFSF